MSELSKKAKILRDSGVHIKPHYHQVVSIRAALRHNLGIDAYGEIYSFEHDDPFGAIIHWDELNWFEKFPSLKEKVETFLSDAEATVQKQLETVKTHYDVIKDINDLISARVSYGIREEVATKPSITLVWLNGSADWYISYGVKAKGETASLDANMILVPYPKYIVEPLLPFLRQLPLYSYSFEASKDRAQRWEGNPPDIGQKEVIEKLRAKGSTIISPVLLLSALRGLIGKAPGGITGAVLEEMVTPTYSKVADLVETLIFSYPPIVSFGREVLGD